MKDFLLWNILRLTTWFIFSFLEIDSILVSVLSLKVLFSFNFENFLFTVEIQTERQENMFPSNGSVSSCSNSCGLGHTDSMVPELNPYISHRWQELKCLSHQLCLQGVHKSESKIKIRSRTQCQGSQRYRSSELQLECCSKTARAFSSCSEFQSERYEMFPLHFCIYVSDNTHKNSKLSIQLINYVATTMLFLSRKV